MNASSMPQDMALDHRARLSLGSSSDAVHHMVARVLEEAGVRGGHVLDVGCGSGGLWQNVQRFCDRYTGLDAVRYDGFPHEGRFVRIDLDDASWHLPDATGDVVVAVETIEHLAFQDVHYPAHRTALLASDLRRIASAAGLEVVGIAYSLQGRLPLSSRHYPAWLTTLFPCALSDNLMIISRKPVD
jgi:2-polyprenyl-3-methyl-5-hydroxy-6-metoxy-1,4-benzoquinol methylase